MILAMCWMRSFHSEPSNDGAQATHTFGQELPLKCASYKQSFVVFFLFPLGVS